MFVLLPLPDSAQKCDTLKTNRYSHYLFGALSVEITLLASSKRSEQEALPMEN
jgi:hypothetical protein